VADVSRTHPDIGPELRRIAQAILDGIDPAVRSAAVLAAGAGVGTGKCQQVWCPVCALAALATGEQHPLLTVVADQSVALLEMIRAMVNDVSDVDGSVKPPPDGPPGGGQTAETAPRTAGENGAAKTRYEAIPVTVDE
jgi:hypothetical protein